jgi:hypothetical protein
VALLMIDIVFTVRKQVPLNLRIQSWSLRDVPEQWHEVRDQWILQHHMRCVLGVGSFAFFLMASIASLAGGRF